MNNGAGRPRVVFMAPVEPWCRENGSSVIIADLLEGLSAVNDADLLPVFLRQPPPGYVPQPPKGFEGVSFALEGVPKWVSFFKAILLGSSPMRLRFANRRVARLVRAAIEQRHFRPTLIHVEHLPLVDIGLKLGRVFRCPVVYRSHNVEVQLMERRLGLTGPLGRILIRAMARGEAGASEACAATLCLSDTDLAWVRRHAPSARAEFFPCSLLINRYDVPDGTRSAEPQIGFVGGLDWAPNDVGLRWFVQEVLPLVTRAAPGARLAVLARGAAKRPWLTGNPAVRLVEDGSDARALFASSWVSIAPLLQGGGVRIKIPESLALGCPVVATTIGAEGHELAGLAREDEPAPFAEACVRYLRQPPNDATRRELRAAVEARYGAHVLAGQLTRLWQELSRDSP